MSRSTRSKQKALLRLLAVAHTQRIDPKTVVDNLAWEFPGSYRRKLRRLSRWIAADSSMSAALTHTSGVLDESDALAIQCGIETNSLKETFSFLVDRSDRNASTSAGELIRSTLGYVVVMLIFAIFVVTFLMIRIVPTFKSMFDEFELRLPLPMTALVSFSESFSVFIPILLLALIGFGILMLFEDVRTSLIESPLGRWLPFTEAHRAAGILRLLAIPTSLGVPVGPTLTAAAQFHPDKRFRRRLLDVRTRAKSDEQVWNSLADEGLISKFQGEQLQTITSPTLRAWTLTTLSDRKHQVATKKAESLTKIMQHFPIIVLGGFVGWVAVAVLATLTSLVLSLA